MLCLLHFYLWYERNYLTLGSESSRFGWIKTQLVMNSKLTRSWLPPSRHMFTCGRGYSKAISSSPPLLCSDSSSLSLFRVPSFILSEEFLPKKLSSQGSGQKGNSLLRDNRSKPVQGLCDCTREEYFHSLPRLCRNNIVYFTIGIGPRFEARACAR